MKSFFYIFHVSPSNFHFRLRNLAFISCTRWETHHTSTSFVRFSLIFRQLRFLADFPHHLNYTDTIKHFANLLISIVIRSKLIGLTTLYGFELVYSFPTALIVQHFGLRIVQVNRLDPKSLSFKKSFNPCENIVLTIYYLKTVTISKNIGLPSLDIFCEEILYWIDWKASGAFGESIRAETPFMQVRLKSSQNYCATVWENTQGNNIGLYYTEQAWSRREKDRKSS